MTMLDAPAEVAAKRALEALRNGVPNGDAVRALGCAQERVLERFHSQLDSLGEMAGDDPPVVPGLLVAGDFGTGKSHLLEYLEQAALDRDFVVSKVVISKETPLYDPVKVVNAAFRMAKLPGTRGPAITELAQRIDYRSPEAASFVRWSGKAPGLLAATVYLHERSKDMEVHQRVVDFWAGEKLAVAAVRADLRQVSAGGFDVKAIRLQNLAPLRFEFASRLARAVGLRGWVLLLDELELVGRYSLAQRGRSYGELARWLGKPGADPIPGVAAVATVTDDYDITVLQGRNDRVLVGERLRAKGGEANALDAVNAEAGMRAIERETYRLERPTTETLRSTFERLRAIYQRAYGWEPATQMRVETSTTRSIRSYVRRWINEWDLHRLYPDADIHVEEEDTPHVLYDEDRALEESVNDESA
jgi:hypothetical protein